MSALRAVFFDLDDTLCDTARTAPYRLHATLEFIAARDPSGRPFEYFMDAMYALSEEQRRLPQLLDLFGVTDTDLIREATLTHDAAVLDSIQLTEGALSVLDDLRQHVVLGLISNGVSYYQREKINRLGLNAYFPAPIISEEVGIAKPDPRIFQLALNQAGIPREEAIYVGNTWDVDIVGAAGAGMQAIWVSNSPAPGSEAAHVIPGVKHLPAVLRLSGALGL